jgi:CO dehydrogenase maturation factor
MKKIIATGKGGVGKTTTLSALCLMMAREGKKVIVFDTDPSMNLAMTFGIPFDAVSTITEDKAAISEDIEEHGIEESAPEILEEHSVLTEDGIRIVIMGAIEHGGDGCLCSAISTIGMLLEYTEGLGEYDIALVDSQAGPEVLGRGLASEFDLNLILTEPTTKSSEVSRQVLKLGNDLGVKDSLMVVNMIDEPEDVARTADMVKISKDRAIGIRFDRCVVKADRAGELLPDVYPDSDAVADLRAVKAAVEKCIGRTDGIGSARADSTGHPAATPSRISNYRSPASAA